MRSNSTNSKKKRPLPGSRDQQKYSDFFESKAAIQRIAAERQSRDVGLNLLYGFTSPTEKSKTTPSNHQSYESSKPKPYVANPSYRIPSKPDNTDLEKTRLNDQLYNTQKELQLTRDTLSETQQRYEKIVKDLKYYINEIESENLKLTKEAAGLRQVNKKEVESIQDRDNRLLSDFQKKIRDLEDQSKFYVQENIKIKQAHEKEIIQMRHLLRDAESKVENFKKEFSSFHNKNKKDVDELAFKDEYIRKMQEGIKEKSKAIFDLRQANEQYLKFLEEKDLKVQALEKEVRKEKESNKFYSDRLNELMIEKINEGKRGEKERGNSLAAGKKGQGVKSSHLLEFEGRAASKGQNTSVKSEGDGGKKKLTELETRNLSLVSENSILKKELKELGDKFKVTEEANRSFKAIVGKNVKSKEQTPRGRMSEGKKSLGSKQDAIELQTRLNEALRENEMMEKCYGEIASELESHKKQLADSETLIKILKDKCTRMKIEQEEHLEVRKNFQNRSKVEQNLQQELDSLQESIKNGLSLFNLKPAGQKQSLNQDLNEILSNASNLIQNQEELEESIQRLDEENQYLTDENKQFQLHIQELTDRLAERESVFKENSELNKKISALQKTEEMLLNVKKVVKNLKVFVGLTYQERGVNTIVEDLEDTLIEVQKIMQNEQELAEKLDRSLAEEGKLREKVLDLKKNAEFFENTNEEITELIEKNQKLEEMLKERERLESEELSEKFKGLEDENKSLEELLQQESQNLDGLRARCDELEEENENLTLVQRDYEKLLVKYTVMKEDKMVLNEQVREVELLRVKLAELENENLSLKGLEGKVKEISEELNKSMSLEHDLGSVTEKYELLLRENDELREKNQHLTAKYQKQLEETSELWDIKGKLQNTLKENQSLANQLTEHDKVLQDFQELELKCSTLLEENSKLSLSNLELQEFASNKVDAEDLSVQLQTLIEENEGLVEKNTSLSEKVNELILESEEQEREKFELEEKLAHFEHLIEKKEEKLEKYRVGSRSLERKLSRTENKTQSMAEKIDKEKQEIVGKLYNDLEDLRSQTSRLSNDNSYLEEEMSKKEAEISNLLQELSNHRKELKSYIKMNEELEGSLEQAKEELEVFKQNAGEKKESDRQEVDICLDYTEKVELVIEYKATQDLRVAELESEIEELKKKLRKETEQDSESKENEKVELSIFHESEDKTQQISELENEIRILKSELNREHEIVELNILYESDDKVQEIRELVNEIQILKSELNKKHEIVDLNILYDSDEKVQELNERDERIKFQEKLVEELKEELERASWEMKDKAEDLEKNKLKIEQLDNDIEEKLNLIESLKITAKDWEMKYNKLAFSESSPSSGSDD